VDGSLIQTPFIEVAGAVEQLSNVVKVGSCSICIKTEVDVG